MKNTKQTTKQLSISIDNSSTTDDEQAKIINKKINKIEQINKQIKTIKTNIDIAKRLYDEHCKKEQENLLQVKEQLIIKLHQRFKQKGFSVWQKELILSKLLNEIEALLDLGYETKSITDIREEINNWSIKNMGDHDKEMINDLTKGFFESMGMNFDEDFNFEDLNNPDFKKQFEKQHSERFNKEQEEFYENEKEDKYQAQQKKVNTTSSDFQKLYKSLVKKAHPDLVIDPLEKERREEWMKKLSIAWEERNYYELLILQKEITNDDTLDIKLSKSQAKPLIRELNKVINDLEADKYELKHYDPNTSFYYENFNAKSEKGILKKIIKHKDYVYLETESIKHEKGRLKTQISTKELLKEIRAYTPHYDEPFNLFDI